MRKDTIADISLIIPVFNSTKDQLDSLLSPIRDKNLDLIIEICFVDDASTQPLSIPDWVKEQFDVAITVNSKNLGPLRSRIKGANLCTGAYVHFVDQDDQLTAEVVDAYAEALRSNPSILMFRARTQNGDRFNERGAP